TSAEVYLDVTAVPNENHVVETFELYQNYPNPFNPTTTLKYGLPESADVTLTIYNSLGEKIATLVKGKKSAGIHAVEWNASKYNSGVYFYELKTDKFRSVKKLLFLK
ncbi:MAG: T9SS type A sorting domain-containing protein, partial [Bacteroidota bacterium]|nr:T9SS type A sorting domain-containing protein [Bacteroidota bacterium]